MKPGLYYKSEDLQHLLRPEHRDEMVVLPKSVLRLFASSLFGLFFGLGMAVGGLKLISPYAFLALPLAYLASLVIGKRINRIEAKALEDHPAEELQWPGA